MKQCDLSKHVEQQVKNILCYDLYLDPYIGEAITRTEYALMHTANKYKLPKSSDAISFSVYNSVQYGVFLYCLSRCMFEKDGNGRNAEKIYYLNKIMNSLDLFYAVEMPSIWSAEHPMGSVMGRAKYGDFFFFYQGCTIGGNKGYYPELGKYVVMYSNSKIIGKSKIGNNVVVSANTYIKDEEIPDNCIVFGSSPHLVVREKSETYIRELISHIWPAE